MKITSTINYFGRRSPVLSTGGMVASSSPQASQFGIDILNMGGTAADAAIGMAAGLQVTMPSQTGLGGDCFILYYSSSTQKIHALNGSGRSSKNLNMGVLREQGLIDGIPYDHAHNVTVPGAPAAWSELLNCFGRLDRQQVVSSAVRLAEAGFPVAPITASLWKQGQKQLLKNTHGTELLLNGVAPKAGEVICLPNLAKSLQVWAEKGFEPFYNGEIAENIISAVQDAGGLLSADDLANHTSQWVTPISIKYRDSVIWECPPNGQGLAALIALQLFQQFDIVAETGRHPKATRYHLWLECMRMGFADAARYIADPDHVKIPVKELLSSAYARERVKTLNINTASRLVIPGVPSLGSDTIYLCTVDGEGNACSFIGSNYMNFGTGIVPKNCGFVLQNRGAGFSFEANHPNVLSPEKRPYNTIIPGLMTNPDKSFRAVFGVMGGFMQPQGHLQVVSGLVDDGLDPQAVLDRPRFRLTASSVKNLSAGQVYLEEGLEKIATNLSERGHSIRLIKGQDRPVFGRGQIIQRAANGVLWGGSEPRADGCAMAGYYK